VEQQSLEEVFALKLRIKYSKLGNLRFIGHLDVMRYFQKAIRRAHLDISYSQGYSPHQIISFAAPLAMGITSEGEYFDADFQSVTHSQEMIDALNSVSVEEIVVTECVLIPDDAKNAMSVVTASDYVISFKEQNEQADKILNALVSFANEEEITILKKTKKKEQEENIKPGIIKLEKRDNQIYMMLQTGSAYNLKPDLVMEALAKYAGVPYSFFDINIHRLETYLTVDGEYQPLYKAGRNF
jgi:radical SAM-linked protein